MDFKGIMAHIPARAGSKRIPRKNLRLMAGQPMMSYALRAALGVPLLDAVYVNTDDQDMMALGSSLGAKVHQRPEHLAGDDVGSDDFNAEIISALRPETLVMVNPSCPLITAPDIQFALESYLQAHETDGVDALITASMTQMQVFYRGAPVNASLEESARLSQETPEVAVLNWAVAIWNAPAFLDHYQRFGFGVWGSRRLFHPLPTARAFKVSDEQDFAICEALLIAQRDGAALTKPVNPAFWAPGRSIEA